MKRLVIILIAIGCLALDGGAWTADDVTVIDDFASYSGGAPLVYCKADEKVYVMNNLGGYEEYGIVETVDGLAVLSDMDIAYIETSSDMAGLGTGTPYINTGYVFKANTRVVCDYEINGHQYNYESPFGSRNGSYWNNAFVFFSRFNRMNTGNFNRSGVETQGSEELETGVRYVIDAADQTAIIFKADDMTTPYMAITTTGTVDDGVNSMYVFNLNTGGVNDNRPDGSPSLMKLYGFKIYEDDELVMDLVPIATTAGKAGVRDKVSGRRFFSATSTSFAMSPDGIAFAGEAHSGTTVYEGKMVSCTADRHFYRYENGQWTDLGNSMVPISDDSYKNMETWTYPEGKEDCFAGVSYDEVQDKNAIADYVGTGNHEPFFHEIPTEEGERYNFSFTFGCDEWTTWVTGRGARSNPDNYMRAIVLNTAIASVGFTENGNQLGGTYGVLAAYSLPHEQTTGHQVSMDFTAAQDHEYLLLQFGYVADNTPYNFQFDHLTVSKYETPEKYNLMPYLSGLIQVAEASEVAQNPRLVEAVNAARALLDSDDTDAQRQAYDALHDALEAALNNVSPPETGDLMVNELMAANVDMFMSPAYNFNSWLELYNTTDKVIDLSGCYLSDDATNLTKWKMPETIGKVPAHGYKVVWMGDNDINTNQAPFKLEYEGGELFLCDSEGNELLHIYYPEAVSRTSYACTTDGSDNWSFTAEPTPGASNNNAPYAEQRLLAPEATPEGGLFEGTVSISVNIPTGTTLRYTTDGTTPTMTNGETSLTGLFTADRTMTYRFRLFADGLLPSPVTTRSYVYRDYDFTLPVIVVSTDDDYLYDNTIGVYVKGTNGRTGNGQSTPANWNMDWNRPVNFHYILPETSTSPSGGGREGAVAVNQDVDFSISGGWTRSNSVKSFKLKADHVYEGRNTIDYPFFTAKPFNRNKTLQIRHGGNDSYSRIKDAALHEIIQRSGIDLDVMSYQPAVHYLNGRYMGLINVREPNNKDFAFANWGLTKDELEVYEQSPDSGAYMMLGDRAVLDRLYELSATSTDDESYNEIKELLDIDEYINYMAAELFLGSWDWPDNNVKAYRKTDGGRYRFTFFDLDAAFETDGRAYGESGGALNGNFFRWVDDMQWHTFDYIYDTGQRLYGEIRFCTFFLNMLENDEFRRKFIDTFCVMGGSVFDYDRSVNILTELGDRVRPTMSWEGASPDGSLNAIRNALVGRVDTKAQHMVEYERLQLTGQTPQRVSLSADHPAATLFINDTKVPYAEFDGRLFQPVTLKAIAPAGYTFAGWRKTSSEQQTLIDFGSSWKYYDFGSLDDREWKATGFDDSHWSEGPAPVGYGKSAIATTTASNLPTYYLRKTITLNDQPSTNDDLTLNYVADDGFILYINGQEAGRHLMPDGTPSYNTFATSYAPGNPDSGTLTIDNSLLRQGDNFITVELHNNAANSSDIYWDVQLVRTTVGGSNDFYATEPIIQMPDDESLSLMACFSPVPSGETEGGTPVRINEVSAANSIYVNENYKRKDWVELYNTTAEDIDIAGMYLSDDINDPLKYQIPALDIHTSSSLIPHPSSIIPAYGHLVVWCDDGEEGSHQLHVPFKLKAAEGVVTLRAQDQSWTDRLAYESHNGDETVGRYPDGADDVYLMNIPTIGKTNLYTSYLEPVSQIPTSIDRPQRYVSDNGGLKISYAVGRLFVRSETSTSPSGGGREGAVTVYTTTGQEVTTERVRFYGGKAYVDVSSLPQGIYVARAIDSEGRTAATKFIKH
ncbi:MAG: lamin tail domain-containing protein [Prevotella sp.]|nr:lamin tail domain-containing protein [Prevotella sp.]